VFTWFFIFMLLNWVCLYIYNSTDLVLNLFYLFQNPSVPYSFFFLGWKICTNSSCCIDHWYKFTQVIFFVYFFQLTFFSYFIFNIWFVVIGLSILFRCGFHDFVIVSYPCCGFRRITVIGPSQSNVPPSHHILFFKMSCNVLPFKYLKSVSANINQNFNFIIFLYFL